ncbi:hypothetical protein [Pseudidiomarina woesei]|uniref:DUF4919 domain-containing protein n=1 Tax=Pseudidiomarina woesei TaxID=1381080 RepID=A0A0K6H3C2_9GAMM|nr:hypothetical protein [Pseudidiomarina woesei]CUA85224.1 hypothetical protein Ga0061064_1154 [Pseudidiomarina woesei]
MKLHSYLLLIAVAAVLVTSNSWASSDSEKQAQALAEYQQHAKNMQSGMSMKAVVVAARNAFIASSAYKPYDGPEVGLQSSLSAAFDSQNWQQCLELSKRLLDYSYVSLIGHYTAYACNSELGNSEQAEFHGILTEQIIDAIVADKNGLSPESAFTTLSTPELYMFLGVMGLTATEQGLQEREGRVFDAMTVHGEGIPEESPVILYFDITEQFKRGFNEIKSEIKSDNNQQGNNQ